MAQDSVSRGALWTGRVMSALPIFIVLMGSVMKLMRLPAVHEGFARAGLSDSLMVPVGLIELICVITYVIPATAVLGAILMTGLLGAACLTSLRIADPTYPLPVILGMLAWGGLFMRDLRVRALIPFRKAERKSLRSASEPEKTVSAA
ncbi:MAG: DoxX family protein [Acidobacteriota bacterium]